jgi:hypothetical protein
MCDIQFGYLLCLGRKYSGRKRWKGMFPFTTGLKWCEQAPHGNIRHITDW